MKRTTSISLPNVIFERTVKELYNAGLKVTKISEALNVSAAEVRSALGIDKNDTSNDYPPAYFDQQGKVDDQIIHKILYDSNVPLAQDLIIRLEKERFKKYSEVEQSCLDMMLSLLSFYKDNYPVGEELKIDKFKAELANNFIKATHQCREEILRKYEIESQSSLNSTSKAIEVKIVGEEDK